MLRNLVSNALKFTPVDGKMEVSIHIDQHSIDPGKMEAKKNLGTSAQSNDDPPVDFDTLNFCGSIVINIKDSGVGMTSENLGRLFQEGMVYSVANATI